VYKATVRGFVSAKKQTVAIKKLKGSPHNFFVFSKIDYCIPVGLFVITLVKMGSAISTH